MTHQMLMQQTAVTATVERLTLRGMRLQALGAATEEQAALLGAGLDRPEADAAGVLLLVAYEVLPAG